MRKEQVKKNPPETSLTPKQDDNTSKSLELSEGQLEAHFRRLNLAHTRRIYKEVVDRAEKEGWSYRDFLALLLAEEVARRKQTRLQRCTRSAHFPFFKTIDEFDFALQSTLRESVIGSCLGLDFVTEGRSLILHGKTGRGKTHLAVAIGYRAIQNGFETLFTTAAELIEDLSNASKRGNLQEPLITYTHPHVLVIDEVGYLTYGPDAANVLFHVVNDRHLRKRPMIFTTNKPMNDWGKVLHDEDMAAATLDRVLERGRFIHLDGPSGRTRHLNPEETLPENTKRLRISGIGGSEFPELTLFIAEIALSAPLSHRKCECLVRRYHCSSFRHNLYMLWGNPRERDPRSAPDNMPNKTAVLLKNEDGSSRAPAGKLLAKFQQFANGATGADSFPQHLDFQLLFSSHPEAMVVLDVNHRIQMCNLAFEKLFQHRQAEILGAELDVLLASDELHGEALGFSARAAAGEVVRASTTRRRRDGSFVDVQVTCVPLLQDGKSVGCYGIYQDITERCAAERAQQEAEKKLSLLFENAVEGIFQTTVDGRVLSVNPALARMCGYSSPAEMLATVHDIGKDFYTDPQTRVEFQREMEEHGAVEAFEYQLRKKNGALIWISENARVIRDADGKVTAYEGTMEDITERKRSELERQITFEIIHGVNVTDNLDELLYLIHQSLNKVLYAENCFVALYESASGMFHFPFFVDQFDEAPPPQQVGRSCTAYVYRTGRAMLIPQQVFDRLAADGEVELVGTPSPSWLGVPLRTPAATIGVLVVQHYENVAAYTERDLEFLASVGGQIALAIDRKRAEEKIRESEARLRVLVEQLPAVLWTVGKDLCFTSALGAGLTRLGLKPNQIVGVSLFDYFETPDPAFLPIAAHRRAISGEPTTFHVEWKGGSYTCHVEPLRSAEGELQGAICMALDITDRRQLEEQLRQAQKMEAVGRLAGGIAHDFNNLLMVIQGYADLMTERLAEGDPLRRNAEQIQTASQRATSLTRQLLAFSRKQMLAPKVLSIQSVVTEMEKILRRLIGEDVQLETSSVPDLGLVKADRSQIEQVILNLAVNARDAMPEGGRLTIETANVDLDESFSHSSVMLSPGPYVMLAVTDNGCGMDAETQAHIFEPFFTTKEKGKGTGLGLATVYGIVKQSGGYVWVYSEPGRGTSFKVYLPRVWDEQTTPGRDRRIEGQALPQGTETVLLVEDEKGVRELAREYLEMTGYTVIEAENGHTALELAALHSGPIHLLMTDVVMPGISGRELSERVKAIRPDIRVLFMSGYTDQAVVHHGILETDAVLLQKPFTVAALAAKLRDILNLEVAR